MKTWNQSQIEKFSRFTPEAQALARAEAANGLVLVKPGPKKCSCGNHFSEVPEDAQFFDSGCNYLTGFYFNCTCGTTLFWQGKRLTSPLPNLDDFIP